MRIEGQPLNSVLGMKSRFMGNGGEECSVEELALQHYAAQAGGSWTGHIIIITISYIYVQCLFDGVYV